MTGGKSIGTGYFDSTELFAPLVGSWTTGYKLPTPNNGLKAATVDNRVLIFGRFLLKKYIIIIINTRNHDNRRRPWLHLFPNHHGA